MAACEFICTTVMLTYDWKTSYHSKAILLHRSGSEAYSF